MCFFYRYVAWPAVTEQHVSAYFSSGIAKTHAWGTTQWREYFPIFQFQLKPFLFYSKNKERSEKDIIRRKH